MNGKKNTIYDIAAEAGVSIATVSRVLRGENTVTEKTKKWVVKQYRMYSDKWRTPFGIYGIAYRYSIHGRIKN